MLGKNCSEEDDEKLLKNMLTVSQDDKKSTTEQKKEKRDEKEKKLREIFNLQPKDPLSVSERDIIEAASKVSGKSVLDMCIEGRLLIAKNEIGKATTVNRNKGKADDNLAQTHKFLVESGQKIELGRLTRLAGTNKETAKNWAVRNNIILEEKV